MSEERERDEGDAPDQITGLRAELRALRAERDALRKALGAFARVADCYDGIGEDGHWVRTVRESRGARTPDSDFTLGDLREARRLLAPPTTALPDQPGHPSPTTNEEKR